MATYVHLRRSIKSSFESMLCFGLPDPTTALIIEVFLKYKRCIFLRNRRGGQVVDFYQTNSDDYACFDSPAGLSSDDLRDQIRVWVPRMSESLCTQLSQRIFQYAQQVAVANHINGGANKVTAFVEIQEPDLQPTDDDDQVEDCMGVWADFNEHDDDGILLYFCNNFIDHDDDDGDDDDDEGDSDSDDDDDDDKPSRGLSCEEIDGLKQERFKSGTNEEDESLMCSICLDEFSTGVKITPLPCSHIFHHNCIASWLQKQGSCPFCRFDITQECS